MTQKTDSRRLRSLGGIITRRAHWCSETRVRLERNLNQVVKSGLERSLVIIQTIMPGMKWCVCQSIRTDRIIVQSYSSPVKEQSNNAFQMQSTYI